MKMERVMIQMPRSMKRKLDALRRQGYTASGYIRALLEKELNRPTKSTGTEGRV